MPPAQDPDVTQSADEDETSDPYIDVQINEDEDIDNALKSWDVLVNPIYKSGLSGQSSPLQSRGSETAPAVTVVCSGPAV